MTWTETHRRTEVLRAVEAALEEQGGGPLPWREEYAEVYPDRDALLLALAHRLRVRREAQLDPELPDAVLLATGAAFATRHVGLIRLLEGPAVVVPSAAPAAGSRREEPAGAR